MLTSICEKCKNMLLYTSLFIIFASKFCKNLQKWKKSEFAQHSECAAPKPSSKYTTLKFFPLILQQLDACFTNSKFYDLAFSFVDKLPS